MSVEHADPREIARFDAMAENWWLPDGEFKALHDLNPVRLKFIADEVALDGANVLDVGCGAGILSESMARVGARVTGIDLAQAALAAGRTHAAQSGLQVDYQCESAQVHRDGHPDHYDLVTCMEMLEHVPDPAEVIQACADMVKPGGTVVFSTLHRTLKSFAMAIVGAEYIAGLLPRGTHTYAKFIRPSEMVSACRTAGLEGQRLRGLSYNPYTGDAALNHDVAVNYILAARK